MIEHNEDGLRGRGGVDLYKRMIIVCLISLMALALFPLSHAIDDRLSYSGSGGNRAVHGVMDLSKWNPKQDRRIALDGEWEFYWGRLIEPERFSNRALPVDKLGYMQVPSTWNGKTSGDERLPAHGSATYRLRLTGLSEDGMYALKKTNIRFASAIYVNGSKVLEDGRPSEDAGDYRMGNKPQLGLFASRDGEAELVVHVSNYDYVNAGIPVSLYFGEQSAMLTDQLKRMAGEFTLLAILLTLSVIFLFCFIATVAYRSKDYSLLVYAAVCWMFAVYTGLMGERPLFLFLEELSFEAAYRFKDVVSLVSFIVLTVVFYRLQPNLISLRFAQMSSALLGIFATLVLVLPIDVYIPLYSYAIAVYQSMLIWLLLRVGLIYIRSSDSRAKTLIIYAALLCVNLYSLDIILFAFSYKDNFWLGQLFLVSFNALLVVLVVIRFFEAYLTVNRMKDKLLRADAIKDDFLTNTSHELRTPLNAIVNIADTMRKGAAGQIDPEQVKNLGIIVDSGRRLTYLVNELLDYSRMKHGDITLVRDRVELRTAVDAVVRMHHYLLEGKPVAIVNAISSRFPLVWVDVNRLMQIMHNLIGNAVKFTDSGTVTVSASIERGMAEVRVSDTGRGIDEAQQASIFLPFEQLEQARGERDGGGSGLGLSITKKLVELHGGDIRVHSVPGSGTVLAFTLPLAAAALQETAAAFLHGEGATGTGTAQAEEQASISYPIRVQGDISEPILVVDDDNANLQTMINLLRIEGYAFTVVNRGQAAVEEIMGNPAYYSLVILDIMMPDISGYDVLQRVRERFSPFELPVLMLTAKNRSEDVKRSLGNGANDIVAKPFELEELAARVQSLTRLKSSVKHASHAEISFLRSQIKPHFLYNALNAIAELCVDEPRQAEQVILHLSQYLRKSFDFKQMDSYTTLRSELGLVQAYVSIEQTRFGAGLNMKYEIEADPVTLIPPLVLQPLVENAIRHGLMSEARSGTVKVTARNMGQDRVAFTIEDDGCGMTESKRQEVLNRDIGSEGVGLWNIRKHLQLLCGADIRIESAPGQGTIVSFDIPMKKEAVSDAKGDARRR